MHWITQPEAGIIAGVDPSGHGMLSRMQRLRDLRKPPHTAVILQSLAEILANSVDAGQLRSLLYLAGEQLGRDHPMPQCETIEDLELATNHIFQEWGWGWVTITLREDVIDIEVGDAPVHSIFGPNSAEWAPAVFEGLLKEWLVELGAGADLVLRQIISDADDPHILYFRMAHASVFESGESEA